MFKEMKGLTDDDYKNPIRKKRDKNKKNKTEALMLK